MSAPSSLWAPKVERPVVAVAKTNMVAGTWLQLSPTSSKPVTQPQVSALETPLSSPAVQADGADLAADELSLNGDNSKFLSNNASRSSSMSSTSTTGSNAFRHPPLGQRGHAFCHSERREATLSRGVNLAFLRN